MSDARAYAIAPSRHLVWGAQAPPTHEEVGMCRSIVWCGERPPMRPPVGVVLLWTQPYTQSRPLPARDLLAQLSAVGGMPRTVLWCGDTPQQAAYAAAVWLVGSRGHSPEAVLRAVHVASGGRLRLDEAAETCLWVGRTPVPRTSIIDTGGPPE